MKKLGIVGWRGMVGSVLMDRMSTEKDFELVSTHLFSTSQAGQDAPDFHNVYTTILDAKNLEHLTGMDIIISCQGGDYTTETHSALRDTGWTGYWIDAASTLRMDDNAIIVLDPVNQHIIEKGIDSGVKDFVGGNCTVSLMLLALGGLFKEGLIEWMTSMTYQAASGAGAKGMIELLDQMHAQSLNHKSFIENNVAATALEIEKNSTEFLRAESFGVDTFGKPLSLNLLPWIDSAVDNGQTREEWKAQNEANKILGTDSLIPIDGTCVRVSSLRCHSQAFTIKLKRSVDLSTVNDLLASHNKWVHLVENNKQATVAGLSPQAVTGSLNIPVGRIRKMTLGDQYLNAFSVGDQLLWGAAEPLRRTLKLLLNA
jgi:aspartate-semialdehyde dehydrogenase